jgi:hypothetical protein
LFNSGFYMNYMNARIIVDLGGGEEGGGGGCG